MEEKYKAWLKARAHKKASKALLIVEMVGEIAKVWGVLGSIALAISAGYWFEFRSEYAIPVSVGSGAALGSLPVLFCFVLLATISLAAYVLGPSMAMWMEVDAQGRRLIDVAGRRKEKGLVNPFRTDDLSRAWLASQVLAILIMACCNWLMSGTDWASGVILISSFAIASLLTVEALRLVRVRAGINGSGELVANGLIIWSTVIQCLVAVGLGRAVFSLASGQPEISETLCWVIWFFICILVIGGQYVFSHAARRWIDRETMKLMPYLVLGMTALPLIAPPLAAKLATPAYRTTAVHGQKCVRLVAAKKVDDDVWEAISSKKPSKISDNLELVVQMDGYQVKRHLNEDTVTIPVDQVRRVTSCEPVDGKTQGSMR